jgi:tRNA-specific 2-thiouridylase
VSGVGWADRAHEGAVMVQCSAHGVAEPAELLGDTIRWRARQRRVAPGQSVVFYDASNTYVLGGGIAR